MEEFNLIYISYISTIYSHFLSIPLILVSSPLFIIVTSSSFLSLCLSFSSAFSLPSSTHRSAFLPYQLTPHSIQCTGFTKGSTSFTATISIGTGEGGRPALGKQTIQDNAKKVRDSLAEMSCNLLYSNAIYLPYASLCTYKLTVNRACQMLLAGNNN